MNAMMFHPHDIPCQMKCFGYGTDDCQFRESCQHRWAVLSSLKRKVQVARKRWYALHPGEAATDSRNLQYTDIVELFKVYLRAGFICWYCLEPMVVSQGFGDLNQRHIPHINDFSLEHKIPLASGGTNDLSNLAFCCIDCNNRVNISTMPESARQFLRPVNPRSITVGDVYTIKKGSRSAFPCNDDNNRASGRKVA